MGWGKWGGKQGEVRMEGDQQGNKRDGEGGVGEGGESGVLECSGNREEI